MKQHLKKESLILLLCLALLACCSGAPRASEEQQTEAAPIDYSTYREEIAEIIRNSPKALEILDFLNQMGASYIYDITMPASKAEKFETIAELGLATGAYTIDMWYAYTFHRYDMVVQNAATIDQLAARLGLQDDNPEHIRIKLNENNADSLEILLKRTYEQFHQTLAQKSSPEKEAMIFIGANIEGMYLLSQLTLYARDNQAMTNYLMQRGQYATNLLRLLEIMSADATVRPYYEKMQPIVHYFQTHSTLNQEELKEVADLIEGIRNQMLL